MYSASCQLSVGKLTIRKFNISKLTLYKLTPHKQVADKLIRRQRGFSLAEILVTLLLLSLVTVTLLDYHRQISKAFQQQWQYRTIWRQASIQAEIAPPLAPAGISVIRDERQFMDCRLIRVTLSHASGATGQISRLHCPLAQH